MKTTHFLLLPAALLCLAACKKNSDAPSRPPVITGFIPTHAAYNGSVTINGLNFGPTGSEKAVKVNGITASVINATDTSITIEVPLKAGDGKISVTSGGQTVESIRPFLYDYTVMASTLAGDGSTGYLDGQGTAAKIYNPIGITIDGQDNLYVVGSNFCIRKITPQGVVSTFAGNAQRPGYLDGAADMAHLGFMYDVKYDKTESAFYTIDKFNGTCRVRKITSGGQVSTIAGGGSNLSETVSNPLDASLNLTFDNSVNASYPSMLIDGNRNIYLADPYGGYVQKINSSGITTFVGNRHQKDYQDGPGVSALFESCNYIAPAGDGNLLVVDAGNHRIRKITLPGLVSTFAGNGSTASNDAGQPADASFSDDLRVLVQDSKGNTYVMDDNLLRLITAQGRVITLTHKETGYADGNGSTAAFEYVSGMVVDSHDNLFLTDSYNNRIRKVTIQ